jgi:hypothetical protein
MKRYVCISIMLLVASFLAAGTAKGVGGVDDSLVMYLPLDKADGKKVADFSQFNHKAEIRGGGKIVPGGVHGNCVELNGTDAIIYVPDHDAFEGSAATIEIWFKHKTASNFPIMWKERGATGGDWWVRIEPGSNRIRYLFRDTADSTHVNFTTSAYGDNSWHHMAATIDAKAKTSHIYIDGEIDEAGKVAISGNFGEMKSTESVTLGSRFADAPDSFGLGFLDEARVWSRVLSEKEIQANMELDQDSFLAVSPKGKLATSWGYIKKTR